MKKISIFILGVIGIISSCKKEDKVSQVVKVSYPTVTISGQEYYSIPVGGVLPSISASSYDSVLKEAYPTQYDASVMDNTKPGLYVVPITAQNKYGYVGSNVVFVAVTNIPATIDLSGNYKRLENGAPVEITKLGNGLYKTNDVGGAPTLQVSAIFAQLNDTLLTLPPQPTSAGSLSCSGSVVKVTGTDTVISWAIKNGSFGAAIRNFKKL